MIVPIGYTQEQVIQAIQDAAKFLVRNYTFDIYDQEDLIQECFFMSSYALEKYDGRVPLKNFLITHLNNRLKNFKRDNYYRPIKCDCERGCEKCSKYIESRNKKKNVLEPIDISNVRDDSESRMRDNNNPLHEIEINEIKDLIDQSLPVDMRSDYLKWINNVSIPTNRKKRLEEKIWEIINE